MVARDLRDTEDTSGKGIDLRGDDMNVLQKIRLYLNAGKFTPVKCVNITPVRIVRATKLKNGIGIEVKKISNKYVPTYVIDANQTGIHVVVK